MGGSCWTEPTQLQLFERAGIFLARVRKISAADPYRGLGQLCTFVQYFQQRQCPLLLSIIWALTSFDEV